MGTTGKFALIGVTYVIVFKEKNAKISNFRAFT
jgi:hypothetical protein